MVYDLVGFTFEMVGCYVFFFIHVFFSFILCSYFVSFVHFLQVYNKCVIFMPLMESQPLNVLS